MLVNVQSCDKSYGKFSAKEARYGTYYTYGNVYEEQQEVGKVYHLVFGMKEVWNQYQNSPYSFYIGDGSFQINCLQIRPGTSYAKIVNGREVLPDVGMNHIGFQVKSMAEVERRLAEWDPPIRLQKSPQDGRYEEERFIDPDGNLFELAEGAWDAGHEWTSPP